VLQIVRVILGRPLLQPGPARRAHPLPRPGYRVRPHPMSVRAKKECIHKSNMFPCMRVNLEKRCVAISILNVLFSA
jgi:hypothetical protein